MERRRQNMPTSISSCTENPLTSHPWRKESRWTCYSQYNKLFFNNFSVYLSTLPKLAFDTCICVPPTNRGNISDIAIEVNKPICVKYYRKMLNSKAHIKVSPTVNTLCMYVFYFFLFPCWFRLHGWIFLFHSTNFNSIRCKAFSFFWSNRGWG